MREPPITCSVYDSAEAMSLAESVIVPLYVATHADQLGDRFYSPERFTERLVAYARRDGFSLVVAREARSKAAVGQAFGYPLPAGSRWWDGLKTRVPEGFSTEDGHRTFAVNEVMVLAEHRRHGIARRMHDELLASRQEQRATLLVRADNAEARAAYERWGYVDVARVQPFDDSPIYEALVLDLRSRRSEPL